jgi:hypothetical protein
VEYVLAVRTTLRAERLPTTTATRLCYAPADRCFLVVDGDGDVDRAIVPAQRRAYRARNLDRLPPHRAVALDGTTLLLLEDVTTGHMLSHYFHLLEHVLAAWPIVADRPQSVRRVVLASDGRSLRNWRGPNTINEKLLGAVFPCAQVLTWKEFHALFGGPAERLRDRLVGLAPKICVMENTIVVDRALTLSDAECRHLNKMLAHYRDGFDTALWDRMAGTVIEAFGVAADRGGPLRVTHVVRSGRRRLTDRVREDLHAAIRAIPGVLLQVVDFARLSYERQLAAVARTDVLIGVHGNGLSHGFFLPRPATVIELFPRGGHAMDYRLLADLRGLAYLGVHAEHGVIDEAAALRLGGYGHLDRDVDGLDIAPIVQLLRRAVEGRPA